MILLVIVCACWRLGIENMQEEQKTDFKHSNWFLPVISIAICIVLLVIAGIFMLIKGGIEGAQESWRIRKVRKTGIQYDDIGETVPITEMEEV